MFVFEKEQYVYNIGEVRIGGMPGEYSTALAGTIFYSGDKIVQDPERGLFDHKAAEELISKQDEMSDMTGNPALVQIFSNSQSAISRYIDFVSEKTDAPFLIGSTEPNVRIAGLRYSEEVGLLDRAVYNSVGASAAQNELDALQEMQHEAAIILAFNPQDASIAGRRAILEEGALQLETGLLELAQELGITKPLIDTATTAMGAGAGTAASFVFVSKSLYGHPTGSGVHNAPSSWPWLRSYKKMDRDAYKTCDIASNLIAHLMGADFLLYGPIAYADKVFPVVAMADVFSAESVKMEFGIDPVEGHPFRKLL
ncbi:MAG: tetrahydromethanopterin S-methyltransferase subunit H [Candidatus Thorarchaeota archaeon]|nr:tetrahydromethanopterin S-methyltransferase subunit H [Candidatus Thorarchaeota archaeon]